MVFQNRVPAGAGGIREFYSSKLQLHYLGHNVERFDFIFQSLKVDDVKNTEKFSHRCQVSFFFAPLIQASYNLVLKTHRNKIILILMLNFTHIKKWGQLICKVKVSYLIYD